MHTWLRCPTRLVALSITSATLIATTAATQDRVGVASPDGRNQVTVDIHDGGLYYSLNRDTHPLFLPSRLGMAFRNAKPLLDSLRITDTTRSTHDETWTQPWGEVARVRDHHNELRVSLVETASPGRRFTVAFRVFDDGVGFRYEFPEQPGLGAWRSRPTPTGRRCTAARRSSPRGARSSWPIARPIWRPRCSA